MFEQDAPKAEPELTADDTQRLRLIEEMLRGRGYSRNQHGFWEAPGARITAAKVGSASIARETDTEDEDTTKVA